MGVGLSGLSLAHSLAADAHFKYGAEENKNREDLASQRAFLKFRVHVTGARRPARPVFMLSFLISPLLQTCKNRIS